MQVDAANDLALLKAEGRFATLPVAANRGVKGDGTVVKVGFPNIAVRLTSNRKETLLNRTR